MNDKNNQVKKQIKLLLAQEDMKAIELIRLLNEKYNKNYSSEGFSQKMKRETITYKEMLNIASVLGYEIVFKKIEK